MKLYEVEYDYHFAHDFKVHTCCTQNTHDCVCHNFIAVYAYLKFL